ncbi:MAG: Rieske 2Fe-2S domain-containing protein [Chloroflexota bacterium]
MLTRVDNELLTRTNAGAPMGELLRRYWIPALLPEELPVPDCPPVRLKLLGESLVAFRDSNGHVGVVAENCPHRGASMFFGRNEEAGLRCVYHGWKFDTFGVCVDMPNEPPESNFKHKVRIGSYPARDHGGVIWVYLGPPALQPALPKLEWALVPESHRYHTKRIQSCNWAQAQEGGIDSSHISFLHRDQGPGTANVMRRQTGGTALSQQDTAPHFEVVGTPYGVLIGARRQADTDHYYWRITQWIAPWYTMIPPFGDNPIGGHAWVPIDDETCLTWSFQWHPTRPLAADELEPMRAGLGIHMELIPGTFYPVRNAGNDFLIDRAAQRSGASFTGIRGISAQDNAMQESMGRIFDRTREHLGSSDTAIIQVRRFLLNHARGLPDGLTPPGINPDQQRVRSVSIVLPKSVTAWPEAAQDALVARPDQFFISA